MKKEFIEFVEALIAAAPEKAEELMTEDVKNCLEALKETTKSAKPEVTDTGKLILKYVQENPSPTYKSKDIASGLYLASRCISGAMRKLVTDGFLEKIGDNPCLYAVTEKGKNYKID